ncbi:MAG: Crp/Fnr family transcriptional regulator [Leptolyngbyaceae cyanobacterium CSU_1_4]|nr:Crp/Fnr family transcriptional regulator [Leptolyngbyaceae cyanobacterium CSU_1_4]
MMTTLSKYSVKRGNPFETSLPETLWHFQRRETIPLNPNTMWQIESGIVRTATWGTDSAIVPLGFWGSNDIIGLPLSQITSYQIDCLTDVSVRILPKELPCPLDAMISHIQQMEELLKMMHSNSVEQRLLKFLFWFANKFGHDTQNGQIIKVRLTHQQIAEVIGSTRVTVTRLLQKFQSERMLNWSEERYMLLEFSLALA